ncbi:MAG: SRPBCC family protein [Archangiaceae bacterium]|nr:SRPBCC family protein [Archangiaceae bacterium]
MSARASYQPGAAYGARVHREGEKWTLVLVRDLRHPPQKVWAALTDPAQLREWAPFDSDQNLGTAGTTARLSTVGAPSPMVAETKVRQAEPHKLLVFSWGEQDLRWELEPQGAGTRLTLWHNINKGFISMGAAGWHICFDVLDALLGPDPLGRMVGPQLMGFAGWQRLNVEYAKQFGVEPPSFGPPKK